MTISSRRKLVSSCGVSPGSRWNSANADGARASRAHDMNLGLQRGERDAHVGRMRRDARLAGAEDRVDAIDPFDRRAAAAGLTFVARRSRVIEVEAARALQQVAACRRHVAQLLRGASQDGAGQHGIALLDQRMVGEVGVRHEGADAQAAVARFLDRRQWQPRNVDEPRRALDISFHQIDEIGAAGDELRRRIGSDLPNRVGDVVGARVLEVYHDFTPPPVIACWIAATMFG